jgi:hypothetical protein
VAAARGLPAPCSRRAAERHAAKLQKPLYAKRAETVKDVPQFWYKAVSAQSLLLPYMR